MRGRAQAAAMVLASVGFASAARAGDSADAAFKEGLKLFDAGKTHEACERFEASYRLDPALGTLQNLATCHEQEGRTARAHEEFVELAARAAQAGLGQKARENLGRAHAAALVPKLSKLELRFGAGANVAEIRIDGTPLDSAAWRAPVALDPGPHTIVLGAPGKNAATQTVNVSSMPGTEPFDVPRLRDTAPPPAPAPRRGVPLRTVGIVVGSVGVVGLGLGAVFGALTFSKKGAAGPHCMGKLCDAQGLALQDSAHGFASASTGTFVVGLAAAGAGALLFVWGGREKKTAIRVAPQLSASAGGVGVDGAW